MAERRIYVSTCAFGHRDLADALDAAAYQGITNVELSSGLAHRPDNLELALSRASQFRFKVHNYFPAPAQPFVLNLASTDPEVSRRSLRHARQLCDLTAMLGDDAASIHAGFAIDPDVKELGALIDPRHRSSLDAALERFRDAVEALSVYAGEVGVRLLLENNVLARFNLVDGRNELLLMVGPDDIVEFFEGIDAPNVGLLLDTGHLLVSSNTLGFDPIKALDALAPYIEGWHVSSNDGIWDTNDPPSEDDPVLDWLSTTEARFAVIEVCDINPTEVARCQRLLEARFRSR